MITIFIFVVPIFAESWAGDLEDMGQGQKLSYMTYLGLLVVNICTKHENDSSNGRKVTAQFDMRQGQNLLHTKMWHKVWK